MLIAKILFTIAVAVFYLAWGWGAWRMWEALPWWGFSAGLMFYLPPATWLLFMDGMGIDRAEHENKLPALSEYLAKLLWPLAALHNAGNNALPMLILFLDVPREMATTKRLNRYADGPDGWRKTLALWIREQLLNFADRRGIHT